jgi:hypothetical protein
MPVLRPKRIAQRIFGRSRIARNLDLDQIDDALEQLDLRMLIVAFGIGGA